MSGKGKSSPASTRKKWLSGEMKWAKRFPEGCSGGNIIKEKIMRLDKYLKVSRLIKRRTVANEACDAGRVLINDKVAKASTEVKVGDVIEIGFGTKAVKV